MKALNRRRFIQGLAASPLANAFASRALAQNTRFKRLIVWYVPEGCTQKAFWPREFGPISIDPAASVNGLSVQQPNDYFIGNYNDRSAATYCLQPLSEHINDINLFSGFENKGRQKGDDHHEKVSNALTGGDESQGSFDQIMAPHLKGDAAIDSIYMPVHGHHVLRAGASNSYLSPARRTNGGTFGSGNWNPMDTFTSLFSNGIPEPNDPAMPQDMYSARQGRIRMLDAAAAQIEAIKCMGGDAARDKLEVLLASYEKLERDNQALLEAERNASSVADVRFDIPEGWTNTNGSQSDSSKYWNRSQDFGKLVDIAIDTTVAALALDRTRVSLMQFSASGGDRQGYPDGRHYQHLNIPGFEGFNEERHDHAMGHSGGSASARRDQARVFRWYYGRLAYLIDRLKAIPDGEGKLFDSTLILVTSEFSTYDHVAWHMPYMTVGNLGGRLKTGEHFNALENGEMRHHGELFLGVAQAMGVNLGQFGQVSKAYTPYLI